MLPLSLLYCQVTWAVVSAAATPPIQVHSLTPVWEFRFDREADLDLDDLPDDWVRRKGPDFPHYVPARIDQSVGADDQQSLRIEAHGAAAAYYSPLIPIDALHTYFFSGRMRSSGLKHDAGMISVSLLNHRRRRIQRVLSRPVLGDHGEWVTIDLGPIIPAEEVRFVVIGCHLVLGKEDMHDIGGAVWFDDLMLGRLPRMELQSNFFRHFISGGSPIEFRCDVSGLDHGHRYELEFTFHDIAGEVVAQNRQPLKEDPNVTSSRATDFLKPQPVTWKLPPHPPGYYSSTATLLRDGSAVASQRTSLVILKLVGQTPKSGEFGWSLTKPLNATERTELSQIAMQAGINWLKYPVWETANDHDPQLQADIAALFDRLTSSGIAPIALLSEPPPSLRSQFAQNWHGVNEIFSLPPKFWQSSLEPVVARYSSGVRHWQLGGESDVSFLGSAALPQTIRNVRREIQRISLAAEVGVPWRWDSGMPDAEARFASIASTEPLTPEKLTELLKNVPPNAPQRWVLLRLSQLQGATVTDRAGQLAHLLIAAKVGGADGIFVDDVYHNQHGLLDVDGAPRELFVPWRTTALALQNAKYLGKFVFPNGSPNAVFSRGGEAVVVVWNEEPIEERLYLGVSPRESDVWGRTSDLPVDEATGESIVQVGPIPKLLLNCSEPVARWRLAAQFESGRMRSEYGGHNEALLVTNTFSQGVSGELSLVLPHEWEAEPRHWTIAPEAGESVRLPTFLRLPPNAHLGQQMTKWDFKIIADRPYRFRVYLPYVVGLDDIVIEVVDRKLPDGRLEIEQIVTNRTSPVEKLDFRCSLFIPGARRQRLQITKLGEGSDRKFYYLPEADRYRDKELWLRLEEDGGRRVLNYRWKLGQEW